MGVTNFTEEFQCPIQASRIFKALIVYLKELIPKLLPHIITSIDVIQGDRGSGSIEQVNFTQDCTFKSVKHRIDEIDEQNLVCRYSLIEGDALGDKLESVDYELKFEPSVDGGCACKMISKYNTLGDFEVDENEIKEGKEKAMTIYKVVESYLLQNPEVYA